MAKKKRRTKKAGGKKKGGKKKRKAPARKKPARRPRTPKKPPTWTPGKELPGAGEETKIIEEGG